jgi:hypothetical protein
MIVYRGNGSVNSGVLADSVLVVLFILVLFDWGADVLQESRVTRTALLFLIAFVLFLDRSVIRVGGVPVNGAALAAVSTALLLLFPSLSSRKMVYHVIATTISVFLIRISGFLLNLGGLFADLQAGQTVCAVFSALYAAVFSATTPIAVAATITGTLASQGIQAVDVYHTPWNRVLWGDADARDQALLGAFAVLWIRGLLRCGMQWLRSIRSR